MPHASDHQKTTAAGLKTATPDQVSNLIDMLRRCSDSRLVDASAVMRELVDKNGRLRAALLHYACEADCLECSGDESPMWCGAKARDALS